jgi:hypothetical protein
MNGASPEVSHPVLLLIGVCAALPILIGLRRRREAIRHRLRNIIVVEFAYLGVTLLLVKLGVPPIEAFLGGIIAGLIVVTRTRSRNRYVPAAVKRKARAEFELRTGKKFNSKKHEYDHGVPFSRGGSHTADNIRVVEKSRNRSKGRKSAWWDVLGNG